MTVVSRAKRVGERIRIFRKQKKMTLEMLAEKMNKSRATICKYENGNIVMDIETLYDFAEAFQVPVCCLMEDVWKDGKYQITLYYDGAPDRLNKSCLVYIGQGFGSDTTFSFMVTNYRNELDQMYFTASLPYINWSGYLVGFWIGLTFEGVTPICMKAVISEKPMEDKELLRRLLKVTPAELNYFKSKDKFLLRSEE